MLTEPKLNKIANSRQSTDNFVVGDRVVVPLQGVGLVTDQEVRQNDGISYTCFKILLGNNLALLLPKEGVASSGVRLPMTTKQATTVLKRLSSQPIRVMPRKSRLQECQQKAKTGDPILLAEITRDLATLGRTAKDALSARERDLLTKIETILAEELSLVQNTSKHATLMEIRRVIEQNEHPPEIITRVN